jgi:hypothetical protein
VNQASTGFGGRGAGDGMVGAGGPGAMGPTKMGHNYVYNLDFDTVVDLGPNGTGQNVWVYTVGDHNYENWIGDPNNIDSHTIGITYQDATTGVITSSGATDQAAELGYYQESLEDSYRERDRQIQETIDGWNDAEQWGEFLGLIAASGVAVYGVSATITYVIIESPALLAPGAKKLYEQIKKLRCFVEGTLVKAQAGEVPIEQIKIGDLVWSLNEQSGQKELKEVLELFRIEGASQLIWLLIGNDTILTTPEHPFYIRNHWITAENLHVGDTLTTFESSFGLFVSEKVWIDTLVTVYNFKVADNHDYFVGKEGVLVHNADYKTPKLPKGFKETKEFGYQHGQKVYKYKGKYYSKDVDGHNGGVWKVFEKEGTKLKRIGTADEKLNLFKD